MARTTLKFFLFLCTSFNKYLIKYEETRPIIPGHRLAALQWDDLQFLFWQQFQVIEGRCGH